LQNDATHSSKDKNDEKKNKMNPTKFIIIIAVFTIFLVIFNSFLRIPFILNTQTMYNLIFYFNLATILIFSIGIMFKPWEAFFICTLGSVLGEWGYSLINGSGAELPAYLLFAVFSSGLAGALISIVRQKLTPKLIHEIFAMVIGCTWQYIGLVIATFTWYYGILTWDTFIVFIFYPLYLTIFNFFLVPISVILNKYLRKSFKVEYFDNLLENQ